MNTALLTKNWFIILILLLMFSCQNREECFNSYEKFIESTYYKGGWISKEFLPKSARNICITNDLDVNKVWFSFTFKNENFIKQKILDDNERNLIKNTFQKESKYFKNDETYWENQNLIYCKISKEEYYAVDKMKNKFYYLRTGYE